MNFDEFKKQLMQDIPDQINSDAKIIVAENNVDKLQNESYQGIVVRKEGEQIGVTLNVSALYEHMDRNDISYDEMLSRATDIVEQGFEQSPEIDIASLSNYEAMKEKLIVQVVPTAENADMLANIPHHEMEDMSVVYRLNMGSSDNGRATVLVTNAMMDSYGITVEQLHQDALEFAPMNEPAVIQSMAEVLMEMMGPEMGEMLPPEEMPMYVASVPDRVQGAGILAYPDFMEQAKERLGGDFYVLPSSVHECILLADSGDMDRTQLEAMVKEVNETQVEPSERLSDKVYHYDSEAKVFELAEKYDARRSAKEAALDENHEKGSVLKELGEKRKEVAEKMPKPKDLQARSAEVAL